MTPDGERIETTRLSDDGLRLITVTRWLDRQMSPPRWRSKNRHRNLKPNEIAYYEQRLGQESPTADLPDFGT